jgi:hypothetical protein
MKTRKLPIDQQDIKAQREKRDVVFRKLIDNRTGTALR